jgi:hypothetical protein
LCYEWKAHPGELVAFKFLSSDTGLAPGHAAPILAVMHLIINQVHTIDNDLYILAGRSSHLLVVLITTCITQVLRVGITFIAFSPFSTLEIKGRIFYVQKISAC